MYISVRSLKKKSVNEIYVPKPTEGQTYRLTSSMNQPERDCNLAKPKEIPTKIIDTTTTDNNLRPF